MRILGSRLEINIDSAILTKPSDLAKDTEATKKLEAIVLDLKSRLKYANVTQFTNSEIRQALINVCKDIDKDNYADFSITDFIDELKKSAQDNYQRALDLYKKDNVGEVFLRSMLHTSLITKSSEYKGHIDHFSDNKSNRHKFYNNGARQKLVASFNKIDLSRNIPEKDIKEFYFSGKGMYRYAKDLGKVPHEMSSEEVFEYLLKNQDLYDNPFFYFDFFSNFGDLTIFNRIAINIDSLKQAVGDDAKKLQRIIDLFTKAGFQRSGEFLMGTFLREDGQTDIASFINLTQSLEGVFVKEFSDNAYSLISCLHNADLIDIADVFTDLNPQGFKLKLLLKKTEEKKEEEAIVATIDNSLKQLVESYTYKVGGKRKIRYYDSLKKYTERSFGVITPYAKDIMLMDEKDIEEVFKDSNKSLTDFISRTSFFATLDFEASQKKVSGHNYLRLYISAYNDTVTDDKKIDVDLIERYLSGSAVVADKDEPEAIKSLQNLIALTETDFDASLVTDINNNEENEYKPLDISPTPTVLYKKPLAFFNAYHQMNIQKRVSGALVVVNEISVKQLKEIAGFINAENLTFRKVKDIEKFKVFLKQKGADKLAAKIRHFSGKYYLSYEQYRDLVKKFKVEVKELDEFLEKNDGLKIEARFLPLLWRVIDACEVNDKKVITIEDEEYISILESMVTNVYKEEGYLENRLKVKGDSSFFDKRLTHVYTTLDQMGFSTFDPLDVGVSGVSDRSLLKTRLIYYAHRKPEKIKEYKDKIAFMNALQDYRKKVKSYKKAMSHGLSDNDEYIAVSREYERLNDLYVEIISVGFMAYMDAAGNERKILLRADNDVPAFDRDEKSRVKILLDKAEDELRFVEDLYIEFGGLSDIDIAVKILGKIEAVEAKVKGFEKANKEDPQLLNDLSLMGVELKQQYLLYRKSLIPSAKTDVGDAYNRYLDALGRREPVEKLEFEYLVAKVAYERLQKGVPDIQPDKLLASGLEESLDQFISAFMTNIKMTNEIDGAITDLDLDYAEWIMSQLEECAIAEYGGGILPADITSRVIGKLTFLLTGGNPAIVYKGKRYDTYQIKDLLAKAIAKMREIKAKREAKTLNMAEEDLGEMFDFLHVAITKLVYSIDPADIEVSLLDSAELNIAKASGPFAKYWDDAGKEWSPLNKLWDPSDSLRKVICTPFSYITDKDILNRYYALDLSLPPEHMSNGIVDLMIEVVGDRLEDIDYLTENQKDKIRKFLARWETFPEDESESFLVTGKSIKEDFKHFYIYNLFEIMGLVTKPKANVSKVMLADSYQDTQGFVSEDGRVDIKTESEKFALAWTGSAGDLFVEMFSSGNNMLDKNMLAAYLEVESDVADKIILELKSGEKPILDEDGNITDNFKPNEEDFKLNLSQDLSKHSEKIISFLEQTQVLADLSSGIEKPGNFVFWDSAVFGYPSISWKYMTMGWKFKVMMPLQTLYDKWGEITDPDMAKPLFDRIDHLMESSDIEEFMELQDAYYKEKNKDKSALREGVEGVITESEDWFDSANEAMGFSTSVLGTGLDVGLGIAIFMNNPAMRLGYFGLYSLTKQGDYASAIILFLFMKRFFRVPPGQNFWNKGLGSLVTIDRFIPQMILTLRTLSDTRVPKIARIKLLRWLIGNQVSDKVLQAWVEKGIIGNAADAIEKVIRKGIEKMPSSDGERLKNLVYKIDNSNALKGFKSMISKVPGLKSASSDLKIEHAYDSTIHFLKGVKAVVWIDPITVLSEWLDTRVKDFEILENSELTGKQKVIRYMKKYGTDIENKLFEFFRFERRAKGGLNWAVDKYDRYLSRPLSTQAAIRSQQIALMLSDSAFVDKILLMLRIVKDTKGKKTIDTTNLGLEQGVLGRFVATHPKKFEITDKGLFVKGKMTKQEYDELSKLSNNPEFQTRCYEVFVSSLKLPSRLEVRSAIQRKYDEKGYSNVISEIDQGKQTISFETGDPRLESVSPAYVRHLLMFSDYFKEADYLVKDDFGRFVIVLAHRNPNNGQIEEVRVPVKSISFGSHLASNGKPEVAIMRNSAESSFLNGWAEIHLPLEYLNKTPEQLKDEIKVLMNKLLTDPKDYSGIEMRQTVSRDDITRIYEEEKGSKVGPSDDVRLQELNKYQGLFTELELRKAIKVIKDLDTPDEIETRLKVLYSEEVLKHKETLFDMRKASETIYEISEWLVKDFNKKSKQFNDDFSRYYKDAATQQEIDRRLDIATDNPQYKKYVTDELRPGVTMVQDYAQMKIYSAEVQKTLLSRILGKNVDGLSEQQVTKQLFYNLRNMSVEKKTRLLNRELNALQGKDSAKNEGDFGKFLRNNPKVRENPALIFDSKYTFDGKPARELVFRSLAAWGLAYNINSNKGLAPGNRDDFLPFKVQNIAALLTVMNPDIALNVNAGEGKTDLLTGIGFNRTLFGQRFIVGVSNEKDRVSGFEDTTNIYKLLRLSSGEYNPKTMKDTVALKKFFANTQVIYTVHDDLRFRKLFDAVARTTAEKVLPEDFITRVSYLLDEADKNKNIEGVNPAILSTSSGRKHPHSEILLEGYRLVAKLIELDTRYDNAPGKGEFIEKHVGDKVVFTEEGAIKFREMLMEKFGSDSDKDIHARELINSTKGDFLTAAVIYEEGRQYIIRNGEIVLIDMGMRRAKSGQRLHLHYALEAKHIALEAKKFKILGTKTKGKRIKYISYPDPSTIEVTTDFFMSLFKNKVYLSGTMLEYTPSTNKDGVSTIPVEPNVAQKLKDNGGIVYKTTEEQKKALTISAALKLVGGQSVLGHIAAYEMPTSSNQIDIKSIEKNLSSLFSYIEYKRLQDKGMLNKEEERRLKELESHSENIENNRDRYNELIELKGKGKLSKSQKKELAGLEISAKNDLKVGEDFFDRLQAETNGDFLKRHENALKYNSFVLSQLKKNGRPVPKGMENTNRLYIAIIQETTDANRENEIIKNFGNGMIQMLLSANTNRAVNVQQFNGLSGQLQEEILKLKNRFGFSDRGMVGFSTQLKSDIVFRIQEIFRLARTKGLSREEGEVYGIYSMQDSMLSGNKSFVDFYNGFYLGQDADSVIMQTAYYPKNAKINMDYFVLRELMGAKANASLDSLLDKRISQMFLKQSDFSVEAWGKLVADKVIKVTDGNAVVIFDFDKLGDSSKIEAFRSKYGLDEKQFDSLKKVSLSRFIAANFPSYKISADTIKAEGDETYKQGLIDLLNGKQTENYRRLMMSIASGYGLQGLCSEQEEKVFHTLWEQIERAQFVENEIVRGLFPEGLKKEEVDLLKGFYVQYGENVKDAQKFLNNIRQFLREKNATGTIEVNSFKERYFQFLNRVTKENTTAFQSQLDKKQNDARSGIESNREMQKHRGKSDQMVHRVLDLVSSDNKWNRPVVNISIKDLAERLNVPESNLLLLWDKLRQAKLLNKEGNLFIKDRKTFERVSQVIDETKITTVPHEQVKNELEKTFLYQVGIDITKIQDVPTLITRLMEENFDRFTEEFLRRNKISDREQLIKNPSLRKKYIKALSKELKIEILIDKNALPPSLLTFKKDLLQKVFEAVVELPKGGAQRESVVRNVQAIMQRIQTDMAESLGILKKMDGTAILLGQNADAVQNWRYEVLNKTLLSNIAKRFWLGQRGVKGAEIVRRTYSGVTDRELHTEGVLGDDFIRMFFTKVEVSSEEVKPHRLFELQLEEQVRAVFSRGAPDANFHLEKVSDLTNTEERSRLESLIRTLDIADLDTKYAEAKDAGETEFRFQVAFDLRSFDGVQKLNAYLKHEGSNYRLLLLENNRAIFGEFNVIENDSETRTAHIIKEVYVSSGVDMLGAVYKEKGNRLGDTEKNEIFIRHTKTQSHVDDIAKAAFSIGGDQNARAIFELSGVTKEDWQKYTKAIEEGKEITPELQKASELLRSLIKFVELHERGHTGHFDSKFSEATKIFPDKTHQLAELYADFSKEGVLGEIVRLHDPMTNTLSREGKILLHSLVYFYQKTRQTDMVDLLKKGIDGYTIKPEYFRSLQDRMQKGVDDAIKELADVAKKYSADMSGEDKIALAREANEVMNKFHLQLDLDRMSSAASSASAVHNMAAGVSGEAYTPSEQRGVPYSGLDQVVRLVFSDLGAIRPILAEIAQNNPLRDSSLPSQSLNNLNKALVDILYINPGRNFNSFGDIRLQTVGENGEKIVVDGKEAIRVIHRDSEGKEHSFVLLKETVQKIVDVIYQLRNSIHDNGYTRLDNTERAAISYLFVTKIIPQIMRGESPVITDEDIRAIESAGTHTFVMEGNGRVEKVRVSKAILHGMEMDLRAVMEQRVTPGEDYKNYITVMIDEVAQRNDVYGKLLTDNTTDFRAALEAYFVRVLDVKDDVKVGQVLEGLNYSPDMIKTQIAEAMQDSKFRSRFLMADGTIDPRRFDEAVNYIVRGPLRGAVLQDVRENVFQALTVVVSVFLYKFVKGEDIDVESLLEFAWVELSVTSCLLKMRWAGNVLGYKYKGTLVPLVVTIAHTQVKQAAFAEENAVHAMARFTIEREMETRQEKLFDEELQSLRNERVGDVVRYGADGRISLEWEDMSLDYSGIDQLISDDVMPLLKDEADGTAKLEDLDPIFSDIPESPLKRAFFDLLISKEYLILVSENRYAVSESFKVDLAKDASLVENLLIKAAKETKTEEQYAALKKNNNNFISRSEFDALGDQAGKQIDTLLDSGVLMNISGGSYHNSDASYQINPNIFMANMPYLRDDIVALLAPKSFSVDQVVLTWLMANYSRRQALLDMAKDKWLEGVNESAESRILDDLFVEYEIPEEVDSKINFEYFQSITSERSFRVMLHYKKDIPLDDLTDEQFYQILFMTEEQLVKYIASLGDKYNRAVAEGIKKVRSVNNSLTESVKEIIAEYQTRTKDMEECILVYNEMLRRLDPVNSYGLASEEINYEEFLKEARQYVLRQALFPIQYHVSYTEPTDQEIKIYFSDITSEYDEILDSYKLEIPENMLIKYPSLFERDNQGDIGFKPEVTDESIKLMVVSFQDGDLLGLWLKEQGVRTLTKARDVLENISSIATDSRLSEDTRNDQVEILFRENREILNAVGFSADNINDLKYEIKRYALSSEIVSEYKSDGRVPPRQVLVFFRDEIDDYKRSNHEELLEDAAHTMGADFGAGIVAMQGVAGISSFMYVRKMFGAGAVRLGFTRNTTKTTLWGKEIQYHGYNKANLVSHYGPMFLGSLGFIISNALLEDLYNDGVPAVKYTAEKIMAPIMQELAPYAYLLPSTWIHIFTEKFAGINLTSFDNFENKWASITSSVVVDTGLFYLDMKLIDWVVKKIAKQPIVQTAGSRAVSFADISRNLDSLLDNASKENKNLVRRKAGSALPDIATEGTATTTSADREKLLNKARRYFSAATVLDNGLVQVHYSDGGYRIVDQKTLKDLILKVETQVTSYGIDDLIRQAGDGIFLNVTQDLDINGRPTGQLLVEHAKTGKKLTVSREALTEALNKKEGDLYQIFFKKETINGKEVSKLNKKVVGALLGILAIKNMIVQGLDEGLSPEDIVTIVSDTAADTGHLAGMVLSEKIMHTLMTKAGIGTSFHAGTTVGGKVFTISKASVYGIMLYELVQSLAFDYRENIFGEDQSAFTRLRGVGATTYEVGKAGVAIYSSIAGGKLAAIGAGSVVTSLLGTAAASSATAVGAVVGVAIVAGVTVYVVVDYGVDSIWEGIGAKEYFEEKDIIEEFQYRTEVGDYDGVKLHFQEDEDRSSEMSDILEDNYSNIRNAKAMFKRDLSDLGIPEFEGHSIFSLLQKYKVNNFYVETMYDLHPDSILYLLTLLKDLPNGCDVSITLNKDRVYGISLQKISYSIEIVKPDGETVKGQCFVQIKQTDQEGENSSFSDVISDFGFVINEELHSNIKVPSTQWNRMMWDAKKRSPSVFALETLASLEAMNYLDIDSILANYDIDYFRKPAVRQFIDELKELIRSGDKEDLIDHINSHKNIFNNCLKILYKIFFNKMQKTAPLSPLDVVPNDELNSYYDEFKETPEAIKVIKEIGDLSEGDRLEFLKFAEENELDVSDFSNSYRKYREAKLSLPSFDDFIDSLSVERYIVNEEGDSVNMAIFVNERFTAKQRLDFMAFLADKGYEIRGNTLYHGGRFEVDTIGSSAGVLGAQVKQEVYVGGSEHDVNHFDANRLDGLLREFFADKFNDRRSAIIFGSDSYSNITSDEVPLFEAYVRERAGIGSKEVFITPSYVRLLKLGFDKSIALRAQIDKFKEQGDIGFPNAFLMAYQLRKTGTVVPDFREIYRDIYFKIKNKEEGYDILNIYSHNSWDFTLQGVDRSSVVELQIKIENSKKLDEDDMLLLTFLMAVKIQK